MKLCKQEEKKQVLCFVFSKYENAVGSVVLSQVKHILSNNNNNRLSN